MQADLQAWRQSALQSEFQESQSHTEELCLKKQKQTNTKNKKTPTKQNQKQTKQLRVQVPFEKLSQTFLKVRTEGLERWLSS